MTFEIIKNSQSSTGYDIEDDIFYGLIHGLVNGWQYEVRKQDGTIGYTSVSCDHGMPELAPWRKEMFEFSGLTPTGRVIFRGYAEEYYDIDERDWFVKTVKITEEDYKRMRA